MLLTPLTKENDDRNDSENKDHHHHCQHDVEFSCPCVHLVESSIERAALRRIQQVTPSASVNLKTIL